jgi:hypothetical protein
MYGKSCETEGSKDLNRKPNSLFRSIIEAVERDDGQTRLLDHPGSVDILSKRASFREKIYSLFGLSFLSALEPDNQRDGQVQLFSSLDDTLSNVVASHDTYEDNEKPFRYHNSKGSYLRKC